MVLVEESVADELVAGVKAGVLGLKVGMPEHNAAITPVIGESSANFIEGLVVDAKDKVRLRAAVLQRTQGCLDAMMM